jgi:hypothetical protein
MRIARCTRVGMLLSGAWGVGVATSLVYADLRAGSFLRNSAFEVCDYVNYHLHDYGSCWRHLMKVADVVDHSWVGLAVLSLAPVLFAWLGGYVTLGLCRRLQSD